MPGRSLENVLDSKHEIGTVEHLEFVILIRWNYYYWQIVLCSLRAALVPFHHTSLIVYFSFKPSLPASLKRVVKRNMYLIGDE